MAEKKIDVSTLEVGKTYTRGYLAELWGYQRIQGLSKGIISAADHVVVLFTTQHKTKWATQYEDQLVDGILTIDGQTNHGTDKAVMHPEAKIYSFYRTESKCRNMSVPFTYQGEVKLIKTDEHEDRPHRFAFQLLAEAVEMKG